MDMESRLIQKRGVSGIFGGQVETRHSRQVRSNVLKHNLNVNTAQEC